MSVKPIDVDLKGNCHHEEDQNLNEVALLHGPNIDFKHELVWTDIFDCSVVVEPVDSFVVIDVAELVFC